MAIIIKHKSSLEPIHIHLFGASNEEINLGKNVLGGKGANLAEMAKIGLNVPSGFTIPCDVSIRYRDAKGAVTKRMALLNLLWKEVDVGITYLEKTFGYMPLVSVRSGARVSMPGMMDTILNVGITSETLPHWSEVLGARTALDSYRRLIQMYSSVALNVPMSVFDECLQDLKKELGVVSDTELDADALGRLVNQYLGLVSAHGYKFPDTLQEQLRGAVVAVFQSWDNPRAVEYRNIHGYSHDWGTAVNIQSMVFGNYDDYSATGVVFTRNPSTGENVITGEFLVNAQGEDVVAGIRTPEPLVNMATWNPNVYSELMGVLDTLESHYLDMQDVEFTVQSGKLYILQTRNGKRSAKAAFKIAFDFYHAAVISKAEAISRVNQAQLIAVMSDTIDPSFDKEPSITGIAAGGTVVSGVAVFTSEDAVNCKEPCILIRKETDPNDIAGMNASLGILTATGGLTSHAAVVARGMNKTCVVGATALNVEEGKGCWYNDTGHYIMKGTKVTIDGSTGNVWFVTDVPVIAGGMTTDVAAVLRLAYADGDAERLQLSPSMTGAEMSGLLNASDLPAYIDTAPLDTRDIPLLKMRIKRVAERIMDSPRSRVVVDLTDMGTLQGKAGNLIDWMFGYGHESLASHKVAAIIEALAVVPVAEKSKVVVKLPKGSPKVLSTFLSNANIPLVGTVNTFADLLAMDGPLDIEEEVINNVFGGVTAFTKAKKLVEDATGKNFSGNALAPKYWFEVLG